jgi:hypothetical protein
MYQLIENFVQSAKEIDDNIFPFIANKEDFVAGKDNVYYSGPYWMIWKHENLSMLC